MSMPTQGLPQSTGINAPIISIVDHSVEIVEVSGKAPLRIDILDQLLYVTPSLNGLLVNMERTQARN